MQKRANVEELNPLRHIMDTKSSRLKKRDRQAATHTEFMLMKAILITEAAQTAFKSYKSP